MLFFDKQVFDIKSNEEFDKSALNMFRFQYSNNLVYQKYCNLLKKNPDNVKNIYQIPFLPVEFFKNHDIICKDCVSEIIFTSSGTTGTLPSRHLVSDVQIYKDSFLKGFQYFYGNPEDYIILALLPSYLERQGSSLIYMVQDLIRLSQNPQSGFFLHNVDELAETIRTVQQSQINKKILVIGVTFALIDFAEKFPLDLSDAIVMETGGMKGRGKEPIREELHAFFKKQWSLISTHSEYGMTELLSQAYSKDNGFFKCPPWMKVILRDTTDPLNVDPNIKSGGINVIDLANIYSCAFIATQDIGKRVGDDLFEVLGRFDYSDVRGCNLMIS